MSVVYEIRAACTRLGPTPCRPPRADSRPLRARGRHQHRGFRRRRLAVGQLPHLLGLHRVPLMVFDNLACCSRWRSPTPCSECWRSSGSGPRPSSSAVSCSGARTSCGRSGSSTTSCPSSGRSDPRATMFSCPATSRAPRRAFPRGYHVLRRHHGDVLLRGFYWTACRAPSGCWGRTGEQVLDTLHKSYQTSPRRPPRQGPRGSPRDGRRAQTGVHLHPHDEGVRHGLAPEAREGGDQDQVREHGVRIPPRRNPVVDVA